MGRLFHFNLCVLLLLECFIFMHHTLDSSVLHTLTGYVFKPKQGH